MNANPPNADSMPLPWRVRSDLQFVPLEFDGRIAWGVKDPLSLSYFELPDESYYVLNQLDGQKSVAEICRNFDERFRPRTLSAEDFRQFLEQLASQNLLLGEMPGQGRSLAARQEHKQHRRRWSAFSNLLAIRFRGFDPDRFLTIIVERCGWLFGSPMLLCGLLMISSALVLLTVHFDDFVGRLPEARALLNSTNLMLMTVVLAFIKVLHEFGHGMTCKRFGGECHEMGVMLLVFTPTLYCNVSDIWMVKDKWQRMMVSLAGMWVELVIAAICTHLWWFSTPGLFHSMCLNVMIVCGLNTLIFNGNPLLRYDGYFVLSDWLEIPNLQQQAWESVRGKLTWWFLGFHDGDRSDLVSRRDWGLFAYGVASTCYRLSLTAAIFWGLDHWLRPFGLGPFVQLFVCFTVGTMLIVPLLSTAAFLRAPATKARVRWPWFWWSAGLTLAGLLVLMNLPFPRHVTAWSLADDHSSERLYVTNAGTLIDSAKLGEVVERGQMIARLDDPRLRMSLIQLEGELNQLRLRLEQLERRRVSEPGVAASIPTVRESANNLELQIAQRQRDADRLIVRAPRSGVVFSPSSHRVPVISGALSTWTGSPLEERNRGCYLRAGTILGSVGEDHCRAAVLLIHQDDISLVRAGQTVSLIWNELSGEIQHGKIIELAAFDLDQLSREDVAKLNLPARLTSKGSFTPLGKWYQARVTLDESRIPLLHGVAGQAKIAVEWQSLAQRVTRWLSQTFPL